MKRKRKLLSIVLMIVLSLALLTGCAAAAPIPSASAAETQQGQPQEAAKEPEAAAPQEQAVTAAPAEPTPTAAEKPSEAALQNAPEPSPVKQEDKTVLQIEGSGLDKPMALSLDELKAMKEAFYEDDFFSLNSYGTKEYFHFQGIKLNAILQKAGLKKSAAAITFIASDGYKLELAIKKALKEDYIDEQDPDKKYPVIIAWNENGQDYDAAEGYPFRLVMGQKEPGDVNKPQWVMNIARITVN